MDEQIMKEYVPLIPERCNRVFLLAGPDVRNGFISPLTGQFNLTGSYVVPSA